MIRKENTIRFLFLMKKEFCVYSWSTEDEETDAHQRFHLRLYGIDAEHRNVCLHVEDFMPYFYVEISPLEGWEYAQHEAAIRIKILRLLSRHDPKDCKNNECAYCWKGQIERVTQKRKLYFYQTCNAFTFLKISFPTNLQRKKAYYRLQNKEIQVGYRSDKCLLQIHENEANPVLQFCTLRKIDSTGWLTWKKKSDSASLVRETTCQRESHCSYVDVSPCPGADERPAPPPYVLSFDIEVFSQNPSRMPDAEIESDVVFQISAVLTRDNLHYKKYLLTLGKPIQSLVGKDVVCRAFETEGDLLVGFTRLVQEENPNLLIGYNIFGFDITYMITRAKRPEINVMDAFDQMGMRLRDRRGQPCHAPETQISWASAAYSHQNFFFLDTEGRLFVDLLPVLRRDYKFENYRLKTISEFFLGDTKDPITPKDIFASYRQSLDTTRKDRYQLLSRVGKYCVQDSALVLRLFDRLQLWIGLSEMAKTCRVPILTLYTQGQQIKVFSQLYFQCTHDQIVVQSSHSLGSDSKWIEGADHYSGAMVFTPDPGVYDWIIPFDFSSLYPTTIIAYNIDFSTLVIDDSVPDESCHIIEWWDHIGCDHDTTVHATKPKQKVCQPFRYRFRKEPMGVIPMLLTQLLRQRKATKNQMKTVSKKLETSTLTQEEKSILETLYQVYDKRQLAYKVSANSMYGAMGVKKGYLPFLPGAMSTTAMGRISIQKAADYVSSRFQGKIVYGDTDSIYCHFPLPPQTDFAAKLWEHSKHIEKDLVKIFPDPMKLVFEEKIYKKFLILTKKRYMALTCHDDGEEEEKLTIRGVLLARRDNAKWVRKVYEKIIRGIMAGSSLDHLLDMINEEVLSLFRWEVGIKQFIVSKTLGKEYAIRAPPTDPKKLTKRLEDLGVTPHEDASQWREQYDARSRPAHAQLADKMKRRGVFVEPGSRIEFVIVRHPDPHAKLFDRIEDPTYVNQHRDMIPIDMLYYVQNLVNPADQVLSVCFHKKNIMATLAEYHETFQNVMEELRLRLSPYYFQSETGLDPHPELKRFERMYKRRLRIKKKPTTTTTVKKKKTTTAVEKKEQKQKDARKLVLSLAKDLLV